MTLCRKYLRHFDITSYDILPLHIQINIEIRKEKEIRKESTGVEFFSCFSFKEEVRFWK